jgi:RNA recognition motif-containing protein
MSAIVEKLSDAVNDVAATLGNTSISDKPATTDKTAQNDAVLASAAEGRRLYIGNLAYATTEGELQAFFKGYLMYVPPAVLVSSCFLRAVCQPTVQGVTLFKSHSCRLPVATLPLFSQLITYLSQLCSLAYCSLPF